MEIGRYYLSAGRLSGGDQPLPAASSTTTRRRRMCRRRCERLIECYLALGLTTRPRRTPRCSATIIPAATGTTTPMPWSPARQPGQPPAKAGSAAWSAACSDAGATLQKLKFGSACRDLCQRRSSQPSRLASGAGASDPDRALADPRQRRTGRISRMLRRLLAVSFLSSRPLALPPARRWRPTSRRTHRPVSDDALSGADRQAPARPRRSTCRCTITSCRRSARAVGAGDRARAGRRRSSAAASRSARSRSRPMPTSAAIAARTARRRRPRRLPFHRRGQRRQPGPETADHRDGRRGSAGQAQIDDQFPRPARHGDDRVQISGHRQQRQRPRRDDQPRAPTRRRTSRSPSPRPTARSS